MGVILVDTSAWIDFFNGERFPILEDALKESRVLLSPLVVSELITGARNAVHRTALLDLLDSLPIFEGKRSHWIAVGDLRRLLKQKGISVSTPDSHIAQCSMDVEGQLLTRDSIFKKIAHHTNLKLCEV